MVQLGSLAGPVTLADTGTGAEDQDAVQIVGTPASDSISLSGQQIDAGTEQIILASPTEAMTIDGGAGDDQIGVSELTTSVGDLTLAGGEGSDTFTLVDLGSAPITAVNVDGGGGTGEDQVEVAGELPPTAQIGNVAPQSVLLMGPVSRVRGQTAWFTATLPHAAASTWTATVDFGDGTGVFPIDLGTGSSFELQHVYASVGTYVVQVSVTDVKGGSASSSHTVVVRAAEVQSEAGGQPVLAVGGTLLDDTIIVSPGRRPASTLVRINAASAESFSAPAGSTLGRITVFGQAGDDDLQIAGSAQVPAWLYGGEGNDRLKGGAGHDVLLGELGDDLLVGHSGRDLLIGGLGADRIVGNADDDILIAAHWLYAEQRLAAHDVALAKVMDEWTSGRSYAARVNNLLGNSLGREAEYLDRANGDFFLKTAGEDCTVLDDDARDLLTGSSGVDWFLANWIDGQDDGHLDKITDLQDAEFAEDLEYIYADVP